MSNIAMLTTWNSACGISEYSKNLVNEFLSLGHNILILNNKVEGEGIIRRKDHPQYVLSKVFGVHWWGEDPNFDADKAIDMMNYFEKALGPIDVLIIQYQSSLYADSGFNKFLAGVKCPILLAQHDSSMNSKHRFPKNISVIVHNNNINTCNTLAKNYIPFPTIEMVPEVFSWGMGGRNDFDLIKRCCDKVGFLFEKHDARKDGWLSEEALFSKISNADVIILWYNEVGITGQSSALRTSISGIRPVIVNDVGWFFDSPPFVHKVKTELELCSKLLEVTHYNFIKENSFANLAKRYIDVCKL